MVKNILKKLLFPFILLFAFVAVGAAQDIQTNIGNAIKAGNSKDIAKFFDKRVEVKIESSSNNYGADQAEMIVKDFLNKFSSRTFSVIHNGTSGGNAQFFIGSMQTNLGSYRVYIYLKNVMGTNLIQEIRFERG
ncbi:MAG: DUF4783 domain-containing protein [Bacteroidetes bacterium]|jgi:hypothetical protein|nr:DUF4783 domain-containing protein [Bacteroidota bacterium]MBP9136164.1 DUF4783 domain-containing protein [Chitinophagales bacterium]MBK7504953.1 DUF4783 domain-containing protein [Bacteroidota bacterium]MBK8674221.1 DUF4783 domain-containing protein [Bacteroidota bacterium]MBK9353756.1 DUF4783 domain-containing protein [Bacteroidota bacterium]